MSSDHGWSKRPSARPQGARPQRRTREYVEGAARLRTPLKGVFSSRHASSTAMISIPLYVPQFRQV